MICPYCHSQNTEKYWDEWPTGPRYYTCQDCKKSWHTTRGKRAEDDPPAELPEDQRLRQQNAPTLPGLE